MNTSARNFQRAGVFLVLLAESIKTAYNGFLESVGGQRNSPEIFY
jgi:hypothetical protein